MTAQTSKFLVEKIGKEWRWRFLADDEELARSGRYRRRSSCLHAVTTLKRDAPTADVVEPPDPEDEPEADLGNPGMC